MSEEKIAVIQPSNPRVMGKDLMEELRAVINSPKYDHMTIGMVIGVLEMTKLHYWQVNTQE
jgi:predicted DNA-binding protein with PD1-like motif